MLNKVIHTILVLIAVSSLLLPFQEYKSIWADFNPSGSLASSEFTANQNKTIAGYELILPILTVVFIAIANIFSAFVKSKSRKTIALILSGLSFLLVAYLYLPLGSPAQASSNVLFRPPVPMIGIGYYVLLITSIVNFVYTMLKR